MTDQEIDAIRKQYATCDPTYGRWHTDESKLRAFAREILSRAIPEGHVVVPKEPFCYVRYYNAQQWSGNGNHDIQIYEGYETCDENDEGAIPVFAAQEASK